MVAPRLLGRGQRRLSLVDQGLEGAGLMDREIGKNLAINLDTGALQPVHELRIGHAVLAHPGIDALDPQGAEIALAGTAVAIGVLSRLLDRLDGGAEDIFTPAVITFGAFGNLFVAGALRDATAPRSGRAANGL